jgi:hypothetical protein
MICKTCNNLVHCPACGSDLAAAHPQAQREAKALPATEEEIDAYMDSMGLVEELAPAIYRVVRWAELRSRAGCAARYCQPIRCCARNRGMLQR